MHAEKKEGMYGLYFVVVIDNFDDNIYYVNSSKEMNKGDKIEGYSTVTGVYGGKYYIKRIVKNLKKGMDVMNV